MCAVSLSWLCAVCDAYRVAQQHTNFGDRDCTNLGKFTMQGDRLGCSWSIDVCSAVAVGHSLADLELVIYLLPTLLVYSLCKAGACGSAQRAQLSLCTLIQADDLCDIIHGYALLDLTALDIGSLLGSPVPGSSSTLWAAVQSLLIRVEKHCNVLNSW